jgi:hypothetical protein
VVFDERKTSSLTLREERRLRVFKHVVLKNVLCPKEEEVTGHWENCIMRNFMICTANPTLLGWANEGRWSGRGVWRIRGAGDNKHAFRILVRKNERKTSLGRHRHRCEDNMEMYIEETGWEGVNLILLAQEKEKWQGFMNKLMNIRVSYNAINCQSVVLNEKEYFIIVR